MRMSRIAPSWRAALWAAAAIVVAAAVLLVIAGFVAGGRVRGSGQPDVVVQPIAATATAVPPAPTPTLPPPSDAPPARLVIPRIEVDAPVRPQVMQADGLMPDPGGPEVVAIYDMSTYHPGQEHRLGFGGNALLSGHLDYRDYGPAVFWNLRKLQPGDEVRVILEDGTAYRYAVTWNDSWAVDEVPWDRVFEINGRDAVTLITCDGTWNGEEYSARRAVRAERIRGEAPAPP